MKPGPVCSWALKNHSKCLPSTPGDVLGYVYRWIGHIPPFFDICIWCLLVSRKKLRRKGVLNRPGSGKNADNYQRTERAKTRTKEQQTALILRFPGQPSAVRSVEGPFFRQPPQQHTAAPSECHYEAVPCPFSPVRVHKIWPWHVYSPEYDNVNRQRSVGNS